MKLSICVAIIGSICVVLIEWVFKRLHNKKRNQLNQLKQLMK